MNDFTDIATGPANPASLTFEKIKEAVRKLKEGNKDFCGYKPILTPWLKGSKTLLISGDKALLWDDICESSDIRIMVLPDGPSEPAPLDELLETEPLTDTLQMRIDARMFNFII